MTNDSPPQYSPPAPTSAQPLSPNDDKLWGSLAHFGNIIGFLPALLIFLILRGRGPIVTRQSKEALNWIITFTAVYVVLIIVNAIVGVLSIAAPGGIDALFSLLNLLIGLVIWALIIVNIVFSIIAGVKVNQTGEYRYPFTLRLIK